MLGNETIQHTNLKNLIGKENTFRLRFNTEHPKNPSGTLPWRLLIGDAIESVVEVPVSEVTFNVPSWNTYDIIPDVGPKWHIGSRGILRCNGSQFSVQPSVNSKTHFNKSDERAEGDAIHESGAVWVNFNPRHIDFADTPPWQAVYGGEGDDISRWKRERISDVRFEVVTFTTRVLLTSGPKFYFGGYGVPHLKDLKLVVSAD